MCIVRISNRSSNEPHTHTELFKIFFSLLTLSTAFYKKVMGREKIIACMCLEEAVKALKLSWAFPEWPEHKPLYLVEFYTQM